MGIDLSEEEVYVESKNDYVRIKNVAITKRDSKVITIHTVNGYRLSGDVNHRVWVYPGKFKHLKNINNNSTVLTKEGYSPVISNHTEPNKIDLYDLEVETEEYYTNGILSHNSTISECLKLALYNKTLKSKKLKDVSNWVNKHGEINLTVQTHDGKEVEIVRKYDPDSFDILGVDYDIASKVKKQEFLSREVLRMPHDIFNNIVSLSLNDFKSFLNMTPTDRKRIFDNVNSLHALTEIHSIIKKEIRNTDSEIQTNKNNIEFIEGRIEETKYEIERLNEKIKTSDDIKISELNEQLEVIINNQKEIEVKLKETSDIRDKFYSKSSKYSKELNNIDADIRIANRDLKLYDEGKCPTCGSSLETDEHKTKKEDLENRIKYLKETRDEVQERVDKISDNISKVDSKIKKIREKKTIYKTEESGLLQSINKLKNRSEESIDGLESLENLIKDNINKQSEIENAILKKRKNKKFLSIVEDVVSDTGIRSLIYASMIPMLNKNINFYLDKFEFPYTVKFNDTFKVYIEKNGLEVDTSIMSTGEGKIADFCVLLAMVKLIRTKYLNLNVLFLDEVFASLDAENVAFVVRVLKDFSKETAMNIFVINHAPLPKHYFDVCMDIINEKGFSRIEVN